MGTVQITREKCMSSLKSGVKNDTAVAHTHIIKFERTKTYSEVVAMIVSLF